MFDEAILRVREELNEIRQIKKCRSCECLLDTVDAVKGDIANIDAPMIESLLTEMSDWLAEGNQNRHNCLGCEVCLPIAPYNEFSK